jgi:hydroxymethylglutaryl-CoA lyase
MEVQASEVAVFTAASEAFNKANIRCSIEESIARFDPVFEAARENGVKVRGYVSCIAGCPYQGWVDPAKVREVTQLLLEKGCYEVSLGDTIGVGTPGSIAAVLKEVLETVQPGSIALHLHDTYGQALANILGKSAPKFCLFEILLQSVCNTAFEHLMRPLQDLEDVLTLLEHQETSQQKTSFTCSTDSESKPASA